MDLFSIVRDETTMASAVHCHSELGKISILTVGPWADVKNDFTWKIIIVLKVRDGHGE